MSVASVSRFHQVCARLWFAAGLGADAMLISVQAVLASKLAADDAAGARALGRRSAEVRWVSSAGRALAERSGGYVPGDISLRMPRSLPIALSRSLAPSHSSCLRAAASLRPRSPRPCGRALCG